MTLMSERQGPPGWLLLILTIAIIVASAIFGLWAGNDRAPAPAVDRLGNVEAATEHLDARLAYAEALLDSLRVNAPDGLTSRDRAQIEFLWRVNTPRMTAADRAALLDTLTRILSGGGS